MWKAIVRKGWSPISKKYIQVIKSILDVICDKKVLLGIGIGLVIGVISMLGYKYEASLSDAQIEEKARALGMHTSDDCKAFFNEEEGKWSEVCITVFQGWLH